MGHVLSVETVLPRVGYDNGQIARAAAHWLAGRPEEHERFLRFLSSSLTERRYFVVPPERLLSLSSQEAKADLFESAGPPLAEAAAGRALRAAGVEPADVGGLIFTSCTSPVIPAIDTYLVDSLGLRRDVVRIPSYQFGCAGGMIGLALADRLSAQIENLLLVSVELCSLVFQPENHSAAHLVGAALFGDGAAAAVLSRRRSAGLAILAHRSRLIPETRHLMGYDIRDSGAHLRLDKELPMHLVEAAPALVDELLDSEGLTREGVHWWLFHPGGTKILRVLSEALGVSPAESPWSAQVLREVGNLSSAAVLFVIDRFIRSGAAKPGDRVLLLGVGPGLTLEVLLAEWCPG